MYYHCSWKRVDVTWMKSHVGKQGLTEISKKHKLYLQQLETYHRVPSVTKHPKVPIWSLVV